MRDIGVIFKREMGAYFNSPIAYIFIIVFLLLTGGWWPDYFLVGAPLLVAIHQIFALIRSNKPRIESAAT